ncbi:MAG: hypothetical protein JST21_14650 [Bacteroidetes bacterium]|nr:hypothetical protein [Bacteroidota bacterium]
MQIQKIEDVINRLSQIIEDCKINKNKAGYFAALYKRMTVAVQENINKNSFDDGARMEKLDVVFALRYLDAYDAYFNHQTCTQSWQMAFDACADEGLIVLQHLMLGVNTHINLDLAIATAEIAPGNSIDALHNDFNHINDLIGSLMDDIEAGLCKVWLPMRILLNAAGGKQDAVLNFSINKAREASWLSAVLLANMDTTQQPVYIENADTLVYNIGTKIKSPGWSTEILLKGIRLTEYDDVARTIDLIENTVVE